MANKRKTRRSEEGSASRSTPLLKPQRSTRKRNSRRSPAMPLGERLASTTAAIADRLRLRTAAGEQRSPAGVRKTMRRTHREAIGVILWCTGALTLLSLLSYTPSDASLNVASRQPVGNWIGPAGAVWADVLLQALGMGAFLVGTGAVLAGWRAFAGKRVLPGLREAFGALLLVVCGGAFAHLLIQAGVGADRWSYPPGGVAGALAGGFLLDTFAVVGGLIVSGGLVLLAVALTADGVLTGLGLRGLGAVREAALLGYTAFVSYRARVQRRRQRAREQQQEVQDALERGRPELEPGQAAGGEWSFGPSPDFAAERAMQRRLLHERIADAQAKGEALGDADAERALRASKERAIDDRSEPELTAGEMLVQSAGRNAVAALTVDASRPVDVARELDFQAEPLEADMSVCGDSSAVGPGRAAPPPLPRKRPDVSAVRRQAQGPPPPSPSGPPASPSGPPATTAPAGQAVIRESQSGDFDIDIVDVRPEVDLEAIEKAAAAVPASRPCIGDGIGDVYQYQLPSTSLLDMQPVGRSSFDSDQLRLNAERLSKTLKHYGIGGQVREIRPGPVITMYEFVPSPGTKVSKIASLADDLAMAMKALRVRIVAPIPGKGAVGIEIPNASYETVFLKELLTDEGYRASEHALPIALGKDIEGKPYVVDLAKMPHLLVAGATGSGKSVSVNTMIMSLLFNSTPDDVRLLMVDPKMLELSVYDGIPHLLLPVVTDPKKAAVALRWAVAEMERRYRWLSAAGVRNIAGFNDKVRAAEERGESLSLTVADKLGAGEVVQAEKLPYIVIVVDELADLMMVASREVEASIMRLAQMARAAGIHLILATQRPSVDVLTGVIKANFPTRIAFQVASKYDSRTILDSIGAEHLLGRGDMLYQSPGANGVSRVHGAFVSDAEVERSVAFIKGQGTPHYNEDILLQAEEALENPRADEPADEMYDQAIAIVTESRQASISMIQRRLRIGYNRAARLVEAMEQEGIVGPPDGAKPREVLAAPPP